MTEYIEPGTRRLMDIVTFTDKNGITYTGEQVLLAMLLHTAGHKDKKGTRNKKEIHDIQEILEDPNLD